MGSIDNGIWKAEEDADYISKLVKQYLLLRKPCWEFLMRIPLSKWETMALWLQHFRQLARQTDRSVDVDVDVVDLRAQADASMPASNNNVIIIQYI